MNVEGFAANLAALYKKLVTTSATKLMVVSMSLSSVILSGCSEAIPEFENLFGGVSINKPGSFDKANNTYILTSMSETLIFSGSCDNSTTSLEVSVDGAPFVDIMSTPGFAGVDTDCSDGSFSININNAGVNMAFSGGTSNEQKPLSLRSKNSDGEESATGNITVAYIGSPATISFVSSVDATIESTSSKAIVVQLDAPSIVETELNFSDIPGTASNGGDYSISGSPLSIAAGSTLGTIMVNFVNDGNSEFSETFNVNMDLVSPNAIISGAVHTHTINDDEGAPQVNFSLVTASSLETAGSANIVVTLSNPAEFTSNIDVLSNDISAISSLDYTAVATNLTFAPLMTVMTVPVNLMNDSLYEGTQSFNLTLSNPLNLNLGTITTHTHDLLDDEVMPTLNFDLAAAATNENLGPANVGLSLTGSAEADVTISYAVTGGTATGSGTDFTLPASTLTFSSGVTFQNIAIPFNDDALAEGAETIQITLSGISSNSSLGTAVHTHTIMDNEGPPSVYFSVSASSPLESTSAHNIVVDMSVASGSSVTVDYVAAGSTATSGVDFTLAAGTATFLPGMTSATLNATILDDSIFEGNESFTVTLSNVSGGSASLGAMSIHTATILDNETGNFNFTLGNSNASEAVSPAQIVVQLDFAAAVTHTIDYSVVGGTAVGAGTDYTLAPGTLTFTPGVTSQTINIPVVNDLLYEGDETIILQLSNPSSISSLGGIFSHTYTIDDDEAIPIVEFSSGTGATLENGATANIVVTLSGMAQNEVTVNYSTVNIGSEAVSAVDYVAASGTLTFPAASVAPLTIPVTIINDPVFEDDEDFQVILSGPSANSVLGTSAHIHTITNDEATPSIQFFTASGSSIEGSTTENIIVSLNPISEDPVTVNCNSTGGTATVSADYTSVSQLVTVGAGSTSAICSLSIVDDLIDEPDQTVILTLSTPSAPVTLGINVSYTHTITDNEATPTVTFASVSDSGGESNSTVFQTVTMSGPSEFLVTVPIGVNGSSTAQNPSDYTSPTSSVTLTFVSPSTSENVTIAIVDDAGPEVPETITLNMGAPSNANLGAIQNFTYTIMDNDIVPFTWTGFSGDSQWTNPSNWSTNVVPGSSDIAIFNNACAFCDVTINAAINASGFNIDATYTGTIAQGVGQSITLGSGGWMQDGGTFNGSDATISISGSGLDLSGGVFNTGTSNINVSGYFFSDGGTFNSAASSITVNSFQTMGAPSINLGATPVDFIGSISGEYLDASTVNFADVSFSRSGGYINIVGPVNVSGNLFLNYAGQIRNGGAGIFRVEGNIEQIAGTSDLSSQVVIENVGASGTSNYNYTSGALPSLRINRTGGVFRLNNTLRLTGNFEHTNGVVDWNSQSMEFIGANSFSVNAPGLDIDADVTISKTGGSTVSLVSAVDIDRDLIINSPGSPINGSAINLEGDLVVINAGSGTSGINFVGTNNQTISRTAGTLPNGVFSINKPSGNVMLSSNISLTGSGQDLTVVSGRLLLNGYSLNISDVFQLGAGATLIRGCGFLSASSITINGIDIPGAEVDVSISDDSITEGGNANLIVSLSPLNCLDTYVTVNTADNIAVSGDDYTAISGSVYTIPAAIGTVSVVVSTNDDITVEGVEDFNVLLSNLDPGVNPLDIIGQVTILDNDSPMLSVADTTVIEGNMAIVTATLSQVIGSNVTFNYGTANNSAISGADYTATSGSATIFGGQSFVDLTIPISADGFYETDEVLTLTLSSLINATAGIVVSNITIQDEFMPNPVLSLNDSGSLNPLYAGNQLVNALISSDAGAIRWCLSDIQVSRPTNVSCNGGTGWVNSRPVNYNLTAGDSAKIVYLWTHDSANRVNEGFISYTINLDTTVPSTPTIPVYGAIPSNLTTTPTLSWGASSDASGIHEYRVAIYTVADVLQSAYAPHVSGTSRSGLSLTDGASYKFRVVAVDPAGNESFFAESSTWIASSSAPENRTRILDLSIYNIVSDGFSVLSNFDFDADNDKTGMILWYCNETDSPGCDPSLGTSVPMSLMGNHYEFTVTGLTSPNNPGDQLNIQIVMSDPDGVLNNNRTSTVTLSPIGVPAFTHVYRSVGQSAVLEDDSGSTYSANFFVLGGEMRVIFNKNMSSLVGIGDALEYDVNGDTAIDDVVIIKKRLSQRVYIVQRPDGSVPTVPSVNPTNSWGIFRVYQNLAGTDTLDTSGNINSNLNPAIASALVLNKTLVADNREVTFAVYKDTADTSTNVIYNSWITDSIRKVNLIVPNKYTQVGESQRHDGRPYLEDNITPSGYTGSHSIDFAGVDDVTIEGFIIQTSQNVALTVRSNGDARISRNIIDKVGTASAQRCIVFSSGVPANVTIDNNICYQNSTIGYGVSMAGANGSVKILQNTFKVYGGSSRALNLTGSGNALEVINNIFIEVVANGFSSFSPQTFNGNVKNNAPSLGVDEIQKPALTFVAATHRNFKPTVSDVIELTGIGVDSGEVGKLDLENKSRHQFLPGALRGESRNIYRSVAEGQTAPLFDDGVAAISVSISNTTGVVTFSSAPPNNVGVGDVVELNGIGIGFIVERNDPLNFKAVDASGLITGLPNAVGNTNFKVCRAYSSLFNAENGNENICIGSVFRNFDIFTGGKNLVTVNESWNLALYGTGIGSSAVTFAGWTTSMDNRVNLFAPSRPNEVGESQRHTGIFDPSLFFMTQELGFSIEHFNIEGIQCDLVTSAAGEQCLRAQSSSVTSSGVILGNIVRFSPGSSGGTHKGIANYSNGKIVVANNIIYGFNTTSSSAISSYTNSAGELYLFGNTMHDSRYCYYDGVAVITPLAINNICSASPSGFVSSGNFDTDSNMNISTGIGNAPGPLSYQGVAVNFINTTPGSEDLHLSGPQVARGNGLNLEVYMEDFWDFLKNDIDGDDRHFESKWSIGADE